MIDYSANVLAEARCKVKYSRAVGKNDKDPVTDHDEVPNRLVRLKLDFALDPLLGIVPNV